MMGLGYIGSSSSSSSNLSPLAPPFTVNRSNHNKPVLNSNPVSHFSDSSYAFSQSTGVQDFFAGSSTTTNDYGYIASEPVVNSPITHNWGGLSSNGSVKVTHWSDWSLVNPSSEHVGDSLMYNHNEAKPFDLSYAIASSMNVDEIPLMSFNDETDYTQNLSELKYNLNSNLKQEGVSSMMSLCDEKPDERIVNDDSLFSKEANIGASFAYNKCLNQGPYCTESLSKSKDDPNMLYYADMIRRANNNGKSSSNDTTTFANNQHRFDSNNFSIKESHFTAFPVYSQSHSSPIQSPENPFINKQNLTTSYDKQQHHMFEDRVSKPTKKSSSIVIKSPTAAVSGLSSSLKSLKIKNAAKVSNFSDVVTDISHTTMKENEDIKLSSATDQLIFEFKAKPNVLKIPDINIPDSANSFDHHNSAEDSPCWKGTPFLPFGSPQTQPFTKKQQKDINIQETDNHEKTSSNPIEVLNSSKVRDEGDDVIEPNNPQISKMNLPKLEEVVVLLSEMNVESADKKLNTSVLVKALYNLSDLLLRACSNEAVNAHDHEVLDHVTHNLGACMSRQLQDVDASTNKLSPNSYVSQKSHVHNKTSGTLQDGVFGESMKNLREHTSFRDLDPPKGDNMVQAIKKILDENLEHEFEDSSDTRLLYKNLWLEAEAELCSLSYRARFERLKRETQKEKPHNLTATRDDDDDNGDGVDSWLLARLNTLKHKGESNAINREEQTCGEEKENHLQNQESSVAAAVGSGSGSEWEHVLKDEVSWRPS